MFSPDLPFNGRNAPFAFPILACFIGYGFWARQLGPSMAVSEQAIGERLLRSRSHGRFQGLGGNGEGRRWKWKVGGANPRDSQPCPVSVSESCIVSMGRSPGHKTGVPSLDRSRNVRRHISTSNVGLSSERRAEGRLSSLCDRQWNGSGTGARQFRVLIARVSRGAGCQDPIVEIFHAFHVERLMIGGSSAASLHFSRLTLLSIAVPFAFPRSPSSALLAECFLFHALRLDGRSRPCDGLQTAALVPCKTSAVRPFRRPDTVHHVGRARGDGPFPYLQPTPAPCMPNLHECTAARRMGQ
jgi:hypothetical protein